MESTDPIKEYVSAITRGVDVLSNAYHEKCDAMVDWMNAYVENVRKNVFEEKYYDPVLPKLPEVKETRRQNLVPSIITEKPDETSRDESIGLMNSSTCNRPQRNASKLASSKINYQMHLLNGNNKLRRPDDKENQYQNIYTTPGIINIKTEKDTEGTDSSAREALNDATNDIMPPPTGKLKKIRRKIKKESVPVDCENMRTTRSKRTIKKEVDQNQQNVKQLEQLNIIDHSKQSRSKQRSVISDVIIQEVPIPIIDISSDTDRDTQHKKNEVPSTNTNSDMEESVDEAKKGRTRRKKYVKRQVKSRKIKKEKAEECVVNGVEEEKLEVEAQNGAENTTFIVPSTLNEGAINKTFDINKSNSSNKNSSNHVRGCSGLELNNTEVLKDLLSTPNINKIIQNKTPLNCTVVLHKVNETFAMPKGVDNELINNSLLTDDESFETPSKQKQPEKKGIKTKAMFSPYANSPVKKRVAAFEQLNTGTSTMRVTRTKTRKIIENTIQRPASTTNKPKYATPLVNNKLPSALGSVDKLNRYKIGGGPAEESIKSNSAMKLTRNDIQERKEEEQRRRLEKEEEVKRKKEALLLAKIEEQKRKREEKQLRAQKTREANNREKEEKLRQLIQEKHEKQMEEQQRKREWALKKAAEAEERRKLEDQARLAKGKEMEMKRKMEEERQRKLAIQPPPPLPTEDWEDSDSSVSNCPKPRPVKSLWSRDEYKRPMLHMKNKFPNEILQKFFQMRPMTPDLKLIFEDHFDERALRRNSSAIWRTPPRCSTFK